MMAATPPSTFPVINTFAPLTPEARSGCMASNEANTSTSTQLVCPMISTRFSTGNTTAVLIAASRISVSHGE